MSARKWARKENSNLRLCVHVLCKTWEMVISRCRFAENGKQMYRNKKKHVKSVQSFLCFCSLNMQICGVVNAVVSKTLNSLLSCWTSVARYSATLLRSHSHGNYWNKSLEEGAPPWSFFSLKIFNMNQLLLQLLNNKSCPKLLSSDCELFQRKKVQHNGYSLSFDETNMTTWTQHSRSTWQRRLHFLC